VAGVPLISAAIMAHPRRAEWVPQLVEQIGGNVQVVWDERNDRWDTGRRSLLAYRPEASHHVVIQDDAIVCRDLLPALARAAEHSGTRPVGLYTGNLRPSHHLVAAKLNAARTAGIPWWEGEGPWWGVGIMLPTIDIPKVVAWGDGKPQIANYDMRISRWYLSQQVPCWYTVPSLVEHRHGDENPSLVPGRSATNRCARWFIGQQSSALDIDWSQVPTSPSPGGGPMITFRHRHTGKVLEVAANTIYLARLDSQTHLWERTGPPAQPTPEEPATPAVEAVHTGGGWYEIRRDGQTVGKVRGREAADRKLAEVA
jgi:hypothetical protein